MALTNEIIQFIRQQRLGYVATVNPDGTPNLSPKGTLTALDENHLIFANIASPKTFRNLQINPSAEVNVLDIFSRRGYRCLCKASIVDQQKAEEFGNLTSFYTSLGFSLHRYEFKEYVILTIESFEELLSPAYYIGVDEETLKGFYKDFYNENP